MKIQALNGKINAQSVPRKQNTFRGIQPIEVKGSKTSAKIFADKPEYAIFAQVQELCNHPAFTNAPIRIMPDVHPSKGTLVGFSAKCDCSRIIPGIIAGDIGCGMLCVEVENNDKLDYQALDNILRNYLTGKRKKSPTAKEKHLKKIYPSIKNAGKKYRVSTEKMIDNLGTLGGGNHFVELDRDKDGKLFLVVHSGSRNFGAEVYRYYGSIAGRQNPHKKADLSYLNPTESKEYLADMREAVKYSALNRRIIADEILRQMGWREKSSFESIHNYIDQNDVVRKGAIDASEGKPVIVPLNMRDGAIVGKGKGNKDWNMTAPHGAGRQFSRAFASALITIEEYKKSMEGIFSSCVSESTLDESPLAYKSASEITENVGDTILIEDIIKPLFNFKD